jgi:colanic acid biosynthesis glycosyl transferase WcaI
VNILVLCPHYAPDVAPTGEVMTAIGTALAQLGHSLHIVTALPWYREHAVEPGWGGRPVRRQQVDPPGRISRVHPFPTDKGNVPARALAFGGFTALSGAVALLDRVKPDVVLAMSPPLTLGPVGWALARLRRAPFVFNVQDIFPDVAVELGVLRNPRVIAAAARLERFTYRHADAVTVLSDELADNVTGKLPVGSAAKVRVIPNFVDTSFITTAETENPYRREYGLEGRTVVMYAGNVGFSQSLDLVLHAARALADESPEVTFVINGGGSARADLEARAAGITNIRFVGMQPKERRPEVLAAADLHLVPLRAGLARSSVPSKLYSILAAGRPVLAAVDEGTEVARTVLRAGAGRAVPPDDAAAFLEALKAMLAEPRELAEMGRAGRSFVEGWASPDAVASAYADLFLELVDARQHGHGHAPRPKGQAAPAPMAGGAAVLCAEMRPAEGNQQV